MVGRSRRRGEMLCIYAEMDCVERRNATGVMEKIIVLMQVRVRKPNKTKTPGGVYAFRRKR